MDSILSKGGGVMNHYWSKRNFFLCVLLFVLIAIAIGCGESTTQEGQEATETTKTSKALPKRDRLTLAYDGWSGTYLPMYVLKTVIEDKLGYKVEIADFKTIPGAFEAVASGRADIFTSAWFPNRDTTFDKYPNLVKLGCVYGGKAKDAFEGWMVSNDVARQHNISHVKDLKNRVVARALDTDGNGKGNLIGSPGTWTSSKRHPEIIADYGLSGLYEVDKVDSEQQLMKAIDQRFRQRKSALFYMCQPAAFPGDVSITDRAIWLKGTEAYLRQAFDRIISRGDLIVNHPEVARILSRCKIPGADIGRAMGQIAEKGTKPRFLAKLARDWIDGHGAQIDSWTAGIEKRSPAPPPGSLNIVYSPEKEDLFLKLATAFNLSRSKDLLPVHPIRLGMNDMLVDALDGKVAAISPDSSIWLAQLDRMWQQTKPGASSLVGQSIRYALSPIVIAMWESKAVKMGYPNKALGWQDLMKRVAKDPGFKWSHPSASTASGLLAITAEFYAGAGKQSSLTKKDLTKEFIIEYVKKIEATVERYGGEAEDRVVVRILAEGGHPLEAFVAQEQLVIFFNRNTTGEKLVAIYPDEGTFWMDHPLVLLDGPWVTEDQQRTFRAFAAFLGKPEQQKMVLREGYRPAQVAVSLQAKESLIKPEFKVDPSEPKTLLKVPSAGVVEKIRELWRLTKKPANIYLVVDVSGSMSGAPLKNAKSALLSFIDQVEGEHDRVALVTFSTGFREILPLGTLDDVSFRKIVRGLNAQGKTSLYDAVAFTYDRLRKQSDPRRINTMIVMTDGEDTSSSQTLETIRSKIAAAESSVLIFNVAYGKGADLDVLQRIARLGDGRAYSSDPETIGKLYELISKFF